MLEFLSSAYSWLIGLPIGASFAVITLPLLAITVSIVLTTRRRANDVRANDNVSTAAIRLVGGAFIFISAFTTATVWQQSNHVTEIASHEFGQVSSIVNNLAAQDTPAAVDLSSELRAYAETVSRDELVGAHAASTSDGANELIVTVTRGIVDLSNEQKLNSNDVKVLLDSLASITDSRHARLSMPYPLLPMPIFVLLGLLGVLTVIVAASYPSGPDRRTKWLQSLTAVAVVASLLGTVVFLLNGESGWMREERLRPVQVFLDAFPAPAAK